MKGALDFAGAPSQTLRHQKTGHAGVQGMRQSVVQIHRTALTQHLKNGQVRIAGDESQNRGASLIQCAGKARLGGCLEGLAHLVETFSPQPRQFFRFGRHHINGLRAHFSLIDQGTTVEERCQLRKVSHDLAACQHQRFVGCAH
ncbi:MAG: hypothetical protein H7143_09775 [Pseudorhodobacter sp.]|nr:hypothetical protein [Rhizobacter sp.]